MRKKATFTLLQAFCEMKTLIAAAAERQLSHNSLIVYRRTCLKIIWAAAEGLGLETLPVERVGEF
jgi:hypothetical protein